MTRSASPRRALPSIDALLREPALRAALAAMPRALVVEAVREVVAEARAGLSENGKAGRGTRSTAEAPPAEALARAAAVRSQQRHAPALRRVINGTGVVLHTNLGRAPLAEPARRAVADVAAGYSSLEYDLAAGRRGDRGAGIERWLTRLTGAEAAAVVNNGAAALLLALSAIGAGRRVVVSRGELVEIGGSFRVPEIMEKSGAVLLEVGSTNRTHLRDYQRALEKHDDIAAILRVHPSNFRIAGFTARPEPAELSALARRHKVTLIEDLGSGALVDLAPFGLEHEPTVREALAAGCDLVTCSGDKLLGGAQAGLILGRKRLVATLKRDPLARALRADKLALAALEATLPLYADPERAAREIPTLAMLRATPEQLEVRAQRLADALARAIPGLATRLARGHGEVGGGALPLERLPDWVVECTHPDRGAQDLERQAREAAVPVIGTIRAGVFRLDVRTMPDDELELAVSSLSGAWR